MVFLGDQNEAKAESLSGSWLCNVCKSISMMGALYEDVENFFGDIFAWYGRIVAKFPLIFILVPLVSCSLLGLGLLNLEYETDLEVLYAPLDGVVLHDKGLISDLYPDVSDHNFYYHQSVDDPLHVTVIVKQKHLNQSQSHSDSNNAEYVDEVKRLFDVIHDNVTFSSQGNLHTFNDLCARRNETCVVEGVSSTDGLHVNYYGSEIFANDAWKDADVFKIRFALCLNDSRQRDLSLQWERAFLHRMSQHESTHMEFRYVASKSLDIESQDQVIEDTKFLGFAVLAIAIFAVFIGSGGNCVTNHINLAHTGVIAAMMSMLAAFGLLSLLGSRIVSLCGVMPFLILGIGTDDMFQLMTEWRQGNVRDSVEERMANTLRSAAVSITITSLTDLIAFCIGATCPYVSVRNFCACSGVGIFLCYMNQLTFFSGCLALHGRRIEASRHWLTCQKVKSRSEMEDDGAHPIMVKLCAGSPPRRIGEEGGFCKKISKVIYTFYPRFILHWVSKLTVLVIFIVYFTISIWGTTKVKQGLDLASLPSNDSHFVHFSKWDKVYFPQDGPYVSFTVNHPITYFRPDLRRHLGYLIQATEKEAYVLNDTSISIIEAFHAHLEALNGSKFTDEEEYIESLMQFIELNPSYRNDIVFNEDQTAILSSRMYVRCRKLEANEQTDMMLQMRRLANTLPFLVLAYSPEFPLYEHNLSIMRNTLLPVGVTMIGMLFVALVFVPHPIAVTCVTISMISVILGMVGFFSFWGLSLSAITTIQIILSVGVCVSFTVHMSHAFMTATGKNRNERVSVALEKVGVPILNGALASLFCALMVAFGSSFIFISFFKTMILVFFLGLLHSIVFLPVMLSFFGPRRTSKPRVFIPVSPSSRSLQDTYRANSIVRPPPARKSKSPPKKMSVDSQTPLTFGDAFLEEEEEEDYSIRNLQLTLGDDPDMDEDSVSSQQNSIRSKKNSSIKRKVSFGRVSIGSTDSAPADVSTNNYQMPEAAIVTKPSNIETIEEVNEVEV